MKRLFKTVAIVLLCGILSTPVIEARGRNNTNTGNNGGNTTKSTQQTTSRPGTSGQGSKSTTTTNRNTGTSNSNSTARRNDATPTTTSTTTSKGKGNTTPTTSKYGSGNNNSKTTNNNTTTRPGNSGKGNSGTTSNSSSTRPNSGNNNNNNSTRPNSGNNNSYRIGNPNQPAQSTGYGRPCSNKPNNKNGQHWDYPGQARPNMPGHSHFGRPTPPSTWRPSKTWRPFTSILGLALGTAYNLSVNALLSSGYTVSSYGDNMIMVANAMMLNLLWPDGVLYYNTAGALYGSQFIYSTTGWDMSRYNQVYAMLVNNYGSPISMQNTGDGVEATWWGTNNQFITLSFAPEYAYNGTMRYYTKLSFGN